MADARALDTRSVLFTDVVGSTELRARLGENAADELRRSHDHLTAEAVTGCGGMVIKGLGDGLMATFTAAADAVTAAVAIQRGTHALAARTAPERRLIVRVGISIGDVSHEAGDVFGGPVVEASRLCAAAGGGEIYIAELVRAMARGRAGASFESLGELELKGIAEPLPACRVIWQAFDTGAGALPVPPLLAGPPRLAYVGRPEVLQQLRTAWEDVRAGGCRTILLAGEPGIGKTRTAAELAAVAQADGALVLFGRCDEDLALSYQPFVEALDWYLTEEPQPILGRLPGELARLVPDITTRVPGVAEPVTSDAVSEEHRLFAAVSSWIEQASSDRGLVLVLDDLHWAEAASLQMLVHILRAATASAGARLLVIGTYRDTDVDRSHPLAAMVGDLRRLPGVERVSIGGLTVDEVLAFMERAAGHPMDDDMAALGPLLHSETEGNPFFMSEVIRHLVETGAIAHDGQRWRVTNPSQLTVPEGVRDVIGRRLSRLPEAANDLLSVASVLGRDFDLDLLLPLVDLSEEDALAALERATRARLIEEVGADHFRFGHALVRSTLYEELSATRRRRLHRRVADVLEKLHPEDVVALAHHSEEAGPDGGDLTRAIKYALAAAAQALTGRAATEAVSRYRHVLELLEEHVDSRAELEARVGLGVALRNVGDATFREALLQAGRMALAEGHVDLALRAALENHRGVSSIAGGTDHERVALIEDVLALTSDEPSPNRARLLATLAGEVCFADDVRRLALAQEAKDVARALDDRMLMAWCIVRAGYANFDPARYATLPSYLAQVSDLADESGDPWLRVQARSLWSASLAGVGRIDEAAQRAEEAMAAANQGSPLLLFVARASVIRTALARGDFAEAERLADLNRELGHAVGFADADTWWAATIAALTWSRGHAGELADLTGSFADQYPEAPEWRIGHAWFLLEGGRPEEARAAMALRPLDPGVLLTRCLPFHAAASLGWVAFKLSDADLAARVIDALRPYRGAWAHYYAAIVGPVTVVLGACEAVLGRWDEALADFHAAIDEIHRAGLVSVEARMVLELAEVHLQRDGEGDRTTAMVLIGGARQMAEEIGADGVVSQADTMLIRAAGG